MSVHANKMLVLMLLIMKNNIGLGKCGHKSMTARQTLHKPQLSWWQRSFGQILVALHALEMPHSALRLPVAPVRFGTGFTTKEVYKQSLLHVPQMVCLQPCPPLCVKASSAVGKSQRRQQRIGSHPRC